MGTLMEGAENVDNAEVDAYASTTRILGVLGGANRFGGLGKD